jgi:hypothetical protein
MVFCAVVSDDRPQEREAPALAVHRVLARRERDVASASAATLPDGEPDQLQTVEHAPVEMQFRVGHLARRIRTRGRHNLHCHLFCIHHCLLCVVGAGYGFSTNICLSNR